MRQTKPAQASTKYLPCLLKKPESHHQRQARVFQNQRNETQRRTDAVPDPGLDSEPGRLLVSLVLLGTLLGKLGKLECTL